MTQATTLEKSEVRWGVVSHDRPGSPRSVLAVRARIAHTSAQKRRLDVFVTEPVAALLGWCAGGAVQPQFARTKTSFHVRLTPAHSGIRATPPSPKSKTLRVAVSGAPLARGLCAKVREVPYHIDAGVLVADLPLEWALAEVEATKGAA